MSDSEVDRLREDLEVIRQAAGVDLPFNRRDVWVLSPVVCAAGALIACLGWWVPGEYRWVAVFPAAVVIGVWLCLARSAHRRRVAEAVRWREQRYGLLLLFGFVPIFVGFMVWEAALGMSRATLGASALFFLGLATAWFSVIDRTRRYYVGMALPLIVFGLAVPFCSPRQVRAGAGIMLIAIGLATAAIQVWQLRSQGRNADAH